MTTMTTMTNTGTHFIKLRELILIPFDDLDWDVLSLNPNAIPILEQNLDKVRWRWMSANPNIFTYDYNAMKYRMFRGGIKEDLTKERFDPDNIDKFNGWGFECPSDDE